MRVIKSISVLGWMAKGAAVLAAGAGFYGVVYGILDGLMHVDPWRLVWDGLFFAVCGATAGALLGGIGRMIDPVGVADFFSSGTVWRWPRPSRTSWRSPHSGLGMYPASYQKRPTRLPR